MILDVIVVLLVLVLALRGLRRGIIREMFSFAGWILGVVAGVRFASLLAPWVSEQLQVPAGIAGLISFVGILIPVSLGVWLIGYLISDLIKITVILRPADKFFGLAVGALEGVLLSGILVGVFAVSPLFPALKTQLEQSVISGPLSEVARVVFSEIRDRAQGRETTSDPAGQPADDPPEPS